MHFSFVLSLFLCLSFTLCFKQTCEYFVMWLNICKFVFDVWMFSVGRVIQTAAHNHLKVVLCQPQTIKLFGNHALIEHFHLHGAHVSY